jgi:hypothetical protein
VTAWQYSFVHQDAEGAFHDLLQELGLHGWEVVNAWRGRRAYEAVLKRPWDTQERKAFLAARTAAAHDARAAG